MTEEGQNRTENQRVRMASKRIASALLLIVVAALTLVVFFCRDEISQYASLGYPAIFLSCMALNCGVFGLSPSGLVAVELSYVFDPLTTAVVSGLGAGLGEITSLFAGRQTDAFAEPKFLKRFESWGGVKIGLVSYGASFLSGNLSDAAGVACGRLRKGYPGFMIGAVAAKVTKMIILVYAAHATTGYFGLIG